MKVRTAEGKTYTLIKPTQIGTMPCIGVAHSNPHIDNCSLCAPQWGHMPVYYILTPSALKPGFAIAANDAADDLFEASEHVQLVEVTAKNSWFNVWVLK